MRAEWKNGLLKSIYFHGAPGRRLCVLWVKRSCLNERVSKMKHLKKISKSPVSATAIWNPIAWATEYVNAVLAAKGDCTGCTPKQI